MGRYPVAGSGPDCKSGASQLGWFDSSSAHHICGCSPMVGSLPSKQVVAGSSPVSRSICFHPLNWLGGRPLKSVMLGSSPAGSPNLARWSSGQDSALSRRQHGFESRPGHHQFSAVQYGGIAQPVERPPHTRKVTDSSSVVSTMRRTTPKGVVLLLFLTVRRVTASNGSGRRF